MEQKNGFLIFLLSCIKRFQNFEISININCYSPKQITNRNIPHMKNNNNSEFDPYGHQKKKKKV